MAVGERHLAGPVGTAIRGNYDPDIAIRLNGFESE
jgi:hypothetical protein